MNIHFYYEHFEKQISDWYYYIKNISNDVRYNKTPNFDLLNKINYQKIKIITQLKNRFRNDFSKEKKVFYLKLKLLNELKLYFKDKNNQDSRWSIV